MRALISPLLSSGLRFGGRSNCLASTPSVLVFDNTCPSSSPTTAAPSTSSSSQSQNSPWPTFQHHRQIHTSGKGSLFSCCAVPAPSQKRESFPHQFNPRNRMPVHLSLLCIQLQRRTITPPWELARVPQTRRLKRHTIKWPNSTTPTRTRCASAHELRTQHVTSWTSHSPDSL
jgi:hypothetical protein